MIEPIIVNSFNSPPFQRRIVPAVFIALLLLTCRLAAESGAAGVISGTVLAQAKGSPVEFATVTVQRPAGTVVATAVTDVHGKFRQDQLPFGHYEVEFGVVGETGRRIPVALDAAHPVVDLGEVFLRATDTIELERMKVTSQREAFYNTIDRKSYTVGHDIQSAAGSAGDLLQNVPSVQVDVEGNVSLRGSDNVLILIDGRTSNLMGKSRADVLQQMAASDIDRIEVITNPSAKYKPDGTAGIINIVRKKSKGNGVSGTVSTNVGTDGRVNGSASLSYRTGKWSFFGSAALRYDYRPRFASDVRSTVDPSNGVVTRAAKTTTEHSRPLTRVGRLNIEYTPNEDDQFGLELNYDRRTFDRYATDVNVVDDGAGLITSRYDRLRFDPEMERNAEGTLSWQHQFTKGRQLNISWRRSDTKELEPNYYTNIYAIPIIAPTKDNKLLTTLERGSELTAEYVQSQSDGRKLESGYNYVGDELDADFLSQDFDATTAQWIKNAGQSNHFIHDTATHALYATGEYGIGQFGLKAGLRGELSQGRSHLVDTGARVPNDYAKLYPTLHLSYRLTEQSELQANYSRRVHRPESDDLNPFPEYIDPFNLWAGNPRLRPEDIDSIEAGYQYRREGKSFLATLYYRSLSNAFTTVSRLITPTTLLTTRENLATSRSGGVELVANTTLGERLSFTFSGNAYQNEIDASNLGFNSRRSIWAWDAKASASWTVTKLTSLQLNANYSAKRLTPQGYRYPTSIVNFGVRHTLIPGRLSAVMTVSDVFDSLRERIRIDTPSLQREITRRRSSRIVYVGLIYNFGREARKTKEDLQFDTQM